MIFPVAIWCTGWVFIIRHMFAFVVYYVEDYYFPVEGAAIHLLKCASILFRQQTSKTPSVLQCLFVWWVCGDVGRFWVSVSDMSTDKVSASITMLVEISPMLSGAALSVCIIINWYPPSPFHSIISCWFICYIAGDVLWRT